MIISLKVARVNANLPLIEALNQLSIINDTLCRYEKDSTQIPISLMNKTVVLYNIPIENIFWQDVRVQ
ncbi:XRE family transcriptional regulator [Tuanshanicoccus lijuaniae]|nr:XRE family transcriptional regulator [Aerococcaceae bacterium zg-1292]QQA38163.1 XRE family transcriptional regulator [Aerococcaceae bacterium zg-1292]